MQNLVPRIGAFVNYVTKSDETIEVKVGISYTSIDQARLNLEKEIPDWQFDRLREEAERIWNRELSKINVQIDKDTDESL